MAKLKFGKSKITQRRRRLLEEKNHVALSLRGKLLMKKADKNAELKNKFGTHFSILQCRNN